MNARHYIGACIFLAAPSACAGPADDATDLWRAARQADAEKLQAAEHRWRALGDVPCGCLVAVDDKEMHATCYVYRACLSDVVALRCLPAQQL